MISYSILEPEDSETEVSLLPNAKLVVIDSVWGHMGTDFTGYIYEFNRINKLLAGGGSNVADDEFVKKEVIKFLEE